MIKSVVTKTEVEKTFPKLMKNKESNLYVYFTNANEGTAVSNGDGYSALHHSDNWAGSNFKDTDDTVTLTIGGK